MKIFPEHKRKPPQFPAADSLFSGCSASAHQRPAEPSLSKTNFGVGSIFFAQHLLCPLIRCFHTVRVDILSPFKGGRNQGHLSVHNAEHTADTGLGGWMLYALENSGMYCFIKMAMA